MNYEAPAIRKTKYHTDENYAEQVADAAAHGERMNDILKDIKPDIAQWIGRQAWEDGHAYGYQEVEILAGNYAIDFREMGYTVNA